MHCAECGAPLAVIDGPRWERVDGPRARLGLKVDGEVKIPTTMDSDGFWAMTARA